MLKLRSRRSVARKPLTGSVARRGLNHDGHLQVEQGALFHEFSLERYVAVAGRCEGLNQCWPGIVPK
jgi:hypothetical protein